MFAANLESAMNHFYDFVVQTSWIDSFIAHLGFDPAKLTVDGVFHHLVEIAVANINTANMLALGGAIFYVATLMMRTIVPLRVIGIISIAFFIAYGVVAGAVSTLLLYLFSLPVNIIRRKGKRISRISDIQAFLVIAILIAATMMARGYDVKP